MRTHLAKPAFLILLAGPFVYLAFGEQPPRPARNANWGKPVSGLSCSIRTSKLRYALDEEILIDFLLRSEVEVPVTVIKPVTHFSYLGTALPLEIVGPDGRHQYKGPVLEPPPPPRRSAFVQLIQGEIVGVSMTHRKPVRIVPRYWSMNKPGSYTIRLTFTRRENEYYDDRLRRMAPVTAWRGTLVSNTVTVRIGPKAD